jgi:hypothetical protein
MGFASWSPMALRSGGTVIRLMGPNDPMTTAQK